MGYMEKKLGNLEELEQEAASFVDILSPKQDGATLVTLSGELGAGKTTFVQSIARVLGITDTVTSPTFVIEKVYQLPNTSSRGFHKLIHIDAYRLKSGSELSNIGFDELLTENTNLIFLEWPERVSDVLPKAEYEITLAVTEENTRTLSYGT